MSSDYGSGLDLDENFDLEVDSTGDLAYTEGSDELTKDLSVRVAGALMYGDGVDRPENISDGVMGEVLTPGVKKDAGSVVLDILNDDPRIDEVADIIISDERNPDKLIIEAYAETEDETQDFEFIVPV